MEDVSSVGGKVQRVLFHSEWTIFSSPLVEKMILISQTQQPKLGITFIAGRLPNLCCYSLWKNSISVSRKDHIKWKSFLLCVWLLGQCELSMIHFFLTSIPQYCQTLPKTVFFEMGGICCLNYTNFFFFPFTYCLLFYLQPFFFYSQPKI